MKRVRQYSTFFVEQLHFGVPVELVQEAILPVPTTAVPLTTEVVDGLINLRGQIVMALDMRARMGLAPRGERTQSVSLILRTADGLVSLLVDHLGDVLDLDTLSVQSRETSELDDEEAAVDAASDADWPLWEEIPGTVHGPLRELVQGIVKLNSSLLLVLDPELLAKPDVCLARESNEPDSEAALTRVQSTMRI